jgi:hypothetical protein
LAINISSHWSIDILQTLIKYRNQVWHKLYYFDISNYKSTSFRQPVVNDVESISVGEWPFRVTALIFYCDTFRAFLTLFPAAFFDTLSKDVQRYKV